MVRKLAMTAICSSLLTLLAVWLTAGPPPVEKVVLENAKLRVSEVSVAPGAVRPRGKRPLGQMIVFLDDCRYERIDPVSGERTVRERKSGDVIWHDAGDDAAQLTNVGRAYREILVEVK